jgi:hypothetical protein
MKSLSVKLGDIFMVWKVFVSFIMAILLLGCATNQPTTQPSYGEPQTQYSCKNINYGMRQEEILQVLGNPHDKWIDHIRDKPRSFDSRGASEVWTYYRSGNFPLKIFISNGRVISCQD